MGIQTTWNICGFSYKRSLTFSPRQRSNDCVSSVYIVISFQPHFRKNKTSKEKPSNLNVADLRVISCKGQIRLNSRAKACGELRNSFFRRVGQKKGRNRPKKFFLRKNPKKFL